MPALQGKICIVTGAASGIGLATAQRLARDGARVLVADLDEAGARSAASDIGEAALPCAVDVADEGSVREMVARACRELGGLDALHNNAAASDADTISRDGELATLDVEVWDRTMAVNARGVMLGCKHAIAPMLERGGGSIVNMSSAAASSGDLQRAAYGASKGAVESLTRYVAAMYGKRGIRCNAIAPGPVRTPSFDANIGPELEAIYTDSLLTPELGRPDDIAAAVAWLFSDDAAYLTAQVLHVDGGQASHHPTFAQLRALR